jgi:hypothetical protein
MGSTGFRKQLKRRHVYRAALPFPVVGWLLVQIAARISPSSRRCPLGKRHQGRLICLIATE